MKPATSQHRFGHRAMLIACGLLASVVVILGARSSLKFESAAGAPATAPLQWPEGTGSAQRTGDKFTLLVFAHPDCPCTRASLVELEHVMQASIGRVTVFVFSTKPEMSVSEAENTSAWAAAKKIPGVTVRFDDHAIETTRFGARVSGQTLLYDRDGRLVFSGGITDGRGHEGDNPGVDAVIGLIRGDLRGLLHAPVFGCSLEDPTQLELKENPAWRKQ